MYVVSEPAGPGRGAVALIVRGPSRAMTSPAPRAGAAPVSPARNRTVPASISPARRVLLQGYPSRRRGAFNGVFRDGLGGNGPAGARRITPAAVTPPRSWPAGGRW